jgi:lipoprotein signal peptidase
MLGALCVPLSNTELYRLSMTSAASGVEPDVIFMIFSTVAIIAMLLFLFYRKSDNIFLIISISFLVGGGIGNMIDRIARGYVVDFFKFLFVKFAVFNVADCFVTVGAVLLAIYLIFFFDEDANIKDNTEYISVKNSECKSENKPEIK